MTLQELLTELSEASGVSGHEHEVQSIVRREFQKYADEVMTTRLGSVLAVRRASQRGNGRAVSTRPKLLLEGHMDEIGLIVTGFDRGFIRFDQIGGFDVRVLLSQNVVVHARRELRGVIGSQPPHVLSPHERDKPVPMSDLFVDVGLPEDEVRQLVTVGDIITIERKVVPLRNNLVAGKAFDDRAAVAVIIEALKLLQGTACEWEVWAVANVQEEDGAWFSGAFTSTYKILPDVAIALDVSHADQPGIGEVNVVPLDKGPGIAIGPNIHPRVHDKLVETARALEIPHRVTAYPGPTGTDAWAIQVVAEGIPTGLIDLPLRYMHTSVETLSLNDLERTARLLAGLAARLDQEFALDLRGQVSTPQPEPRKKAVPSASRPPRRKQRAH